MSQEDEIHIVLTSLLGDRVIAYRPALARSLASIHAALFLAQASYWQSKVGRDRWWFKLRDAERDDAGKILPPSKASQQSWEWELGMTRCEQEGARRILKQHGLLEEQRMGIPARLYYRVNLGRLKEFLISAHQKEEFHRQDGEMVPSGCPNSSEPLEEIGPSNTQTKTEIKASKTTTTEEAAAESCPMQLDALIFEPAISQHVQKLTEILRQEHVSNGRVAQNLLDELAAAVEAAGRGEREKIVNPMAWLRAVIKKNQQGKFDPVCCTVVQSRRKVRAQEAELKSAPVCVPRASQEKSQEHITKLFTMLARDKSTQEL